MTIVHHSTALPLGEPFRSTRQLLGPPKLAPGWAYAVLCKECRQVAHLGVHLLWTWAKGKTYVSGRAWYYGKTRRRYGDRERLYLPTITIHAGTETTERQQLKTLLHEIAHINAGHEANHGPVFVKECLRLYKKYNLVDDVAEGRLYEYACVKRAAQKMVARRRK